MTFQVAEVSEGENKCLSYGDPIDQSCQINQNVSKSWADQLNFASWLLDQNVSYRLTISGPTFQSASVLIPLPDLSVVFLKGKSWVLPIMEKDEMRMSTEEGGPLKFFRTSSGGDLNKELVKIAIVPVS
eukprot:Gregarina_sp_Poly_1__1818@NODE_1471_length_4057_cov_168_688972_g180_i3_p3_GENE_NODE_1471_length_4057_cov_168_688972_g180_i3NODE_1471_length_4057_cov_168_688972_g180_i3_p3_ORF_typecomplete_len129_score17_38_NODE_1471_length_4057_cov_168_688972_g180_i334420